MLRKAFRKLLGWLDVLTTPECWMQIEDYSEAWDKELTWLLDNGYTFTNIDRYRATIADYRVWIENHPYASFSIESITRPVRPRRVTILRAGRVLGKVVRAESFRGDRGYRHKKGN